MKGAAQGPCDPNTHFHSQSQNILGHPNPHGSRWGPHLSVPPQITPHTPPSCVVPQGALYLCWSCTSRTLFQYMRDGRGLGLPSGHTGHCK